MSGARTRGLEWSVAARPARGQVESGDFSCVREVGDAILLVAVDVLGHGTGAARSARRFLDLVEIEPVLDLPSLFARCDTLLRGDRGAVMTAALVVPSRRSLHWLGVGNVQAVIVRGGASGPREWLMLRSGVIGSGIGRVEARTATLERGDVLVLATDGIHAAYATTVNPLDPIDRVAQAVLDAHGREDDDSLVLAARLGETSS